eukprot:8224879-Pyramimonas_sp.AAC.1
MLARKGAIAPAPVETSKLRSHIYTVGSRDKIQEIEHRSPKKARTSRRISPRKQLTTTTSLDSPS